MGQTLKLAASQPAVDREWEQYAAISREARRNPMLVDDPQHLALRRQAYRRFLSAFEGGSNG